MYICKYVYATIWRLKLVGPQTQKYCLLTVPEHVFLCVLTLSMSYWPSQFSDYGSINATQNQPEKQDPKVTKEAYNRHIQELKWRLEEDVNAIANKFSGRHVHRSAAQIRGQILYTMVEDKKNPEPAY
jgi:hypothetical protein